MHCFGWWYNDPGEIVVVFLFARKKSKKKSKKDKKKKKKKKAHQLTIGLSTRTPAQRNPPSRNKAL